MSEILDRYDVQAIEYVKDWLESLYVAKGDDELVLFPGGVVADYHIPTRSPFCILEVPTKAEVVKQYLNETNMLKYPFAIQISIESTDLWAGSMANLYLTKILRQKILDEMKDVTLIEEVELGDSEFFSVEDDRGKNNGVLLCSSRTEVSIFTTEEAMTDDVAYETLVVRLRDANNTRTIEQEAFDIEQDEEE